MKKQPVRNFGQTLIELLVALGAGVIIMVALVGVVVVAGKNSQFAKNQNLATRFSQEGIELIRSKRDQQGWTTFYSNYNGQPQCIDASGNFTNMSTDCGKNVTNFFNRSASFVDNSGDQTQLEVTVTTSWQEISATHRSKQTTILSKWE